MTRIALPSRAGRRGRMRQSIVSLGLAACCLTLISACSSGSIQEASIASANAAIETGYVISEGDRVKITVFDEASLTGEYDVGLDGTIPFPLIGDVAAKGASPEELNRAITTALRDGGYVLSPRVAVEVMQHRPFYVLGEVRQPGEYIYVSNLTLEQAIAKAGGYTPRANKDLVILQRKNWTSARRIRLGEAPLLIAPGDTITIREAFF